MQNLTNCGGEVNWNWILRGVDLRELFDQTSQGGTTIIYPHICKFKDRDTFVWGKICIIDWQGRITETMSGFLYNG